jgi:hypothetical protein
MDQSDRKTRSSTADARSTASTKGLAEAEKWVRIFKAGGGKRDAGWPRKNFDRREISFRRTDFEEQISFDVVIRASAAEASAVALHDFRSGDHPTPSPRHAVMLSAAKHLRLLFVMLERAVTQAR